MRTTVAGLATGGARVGAGEGVVEDAVGAVGTLQREVGSRRGGRGGVASRAPRAEVRRRGVGAWWGRGRVVACAVLVGMLLTCASCYRVLRRKSGGDQGREQGGM